MRTRRDPRSERASRRVGEGARPRFDLAGGASRRRDLRAEREAARVDGAGRPRFDLSAAGRGHGPQRAAAEPVRAAPAIVRIEAPALLVVAVVDAPAGRLGGHDQQVLGAARALADAGGGAVVLLGKTVPDDAGAAGADRVGAFAGDDPDAAAESLVAALAVLSPRHVLFAESTDGGDLARRVAVRLGERLFTAAEQVGTRGASRAARGRTVEQRTATPRFVTLADGAAAPHRGGVHEARPVELPAGTGVARSSVRDVPPDPATVPLAEADFVVAAGNGVTDFDAFRSLAAALGAAPGASRMVCDAGLMPRTAQVGASGTVLSGSVYLALGIAGAPQHLQGVAGCETVIAVNTDLHAAMVERADLAIVADAQAVMPALLAALARGRQ